MTDAIGLVLVGIGVLFDLAGCIGLVRLPDVYNRLQAATKCVTLGTCLIIGGASLIAGSVPGALKGFVCMAFVLLTSPTAAHALAKGAHLSGVKLWEKSVDDAYARARGEAPAGGPR
jgi:multicomponent Na+:H+ antiporter subunit G